MMKNIYIALTLLHLIGIPSIAFSQGYAIFPQESSNNLILLSADTKSSTFVVRNKSDEQTTGYIGDFLGSEESQAIEVTDKYVTLETVEHFSDKDGKQREQRTRMQLPVHPSLDGNGKGTQ